jgi:site-specific DNA-methyltransferase (adenine-specific)/adenine-specific DNA-methyltransferase
MPTLNWIGKEAVVNHHQHVPFRLLKDVPDLACGDPGSGNLIVQGDNLVALKALLPYYAGQVKCIYIDPPYNTGNEGWAYNDNVNSPLIRDWLGKTVGKEAEDLSRHDKWLCMMYPRLALLRQFLTQDGVILVSLDDTELAHLKLILDDIFGKSNALGTIVWNTRNTDNRIKTHLSPDHENVLVYGKSQDSRIEGRVIDRSDFKNLDSDPRGPYVTDPLTGKATAEERPNLHAYRMQQPGTSNIWEPDPAHGWITDEAGYRRLLADNRIWWPPNPVTGKPRKKRFLSETKARMPASSFWPEFRTQSGASDLDEILGERMFAFPKPVQLVQRLIDYCAPPGSIVLDSFAGSGTTGHAVLQLNAELTAKSTVNTKKPEKIPSVLSAFSAVETVPARRFILVEMESKVARDITAERVRRVAEGYTNAKGEKVNGLGGGFRFCELGEPLFDESGKIRDTVRFADLARHVFFSETGEPLPRERVPNTPFLGACRGVGIYLLYNGILGDKTPNGGNVLTRAVLAQLPAFDGPKVIYCAGCLLCRDRLQAERITIRQTPYEIKVA